MIVKTHNDDVSQHPRVEARIDSLCSRVYETVILVAMVYLALC
jgi:hypothetical protein